MRYFAKPETWFVEGTEVEFLEDLRPFMEAGIFCGIREEYDGTIHEDEEICGFGEFEAFEDGELE